LITAEAFVMCPCP